MESPLRLSSVEINYWQHNSRQSVSTCLTLSFQCFLPIIRFNLIIKSPLQRFQTRHRSHLSKWVKTHHHHQKKMFNVYYAASSMFIIMFIIRRVQCLLCGEWALCSSDNIAPLSTGPYLACCNYRRHHHMYYQIFLMFFFVVNIKTIFNRCSCVSPNCGCYQNWTDKCI